MIGYESISSQSTYQRRNAPNDPLKKARASTPVMMASSMISTQTTKTGIRATLRRRSRKVFTDMEEPEKESHVG
jgi:hypothetical protein